MRIVVISDTHGAHEDLMLPQGDVLIHCGDIENLFNRDTAAVQKMDDWFGRQDFEHILCIGGNHDFDIERRINAGARPFQNAVFLHHAAHVIDGVTFYGASCVPALADHAFYADDAALIEAWADIPDSVDVLITHTPPAGVLDRSSRGDRLGCPHLAKRLKTIRPALHCFGHVHASAGVHGRQGRRSVNASMVNSDYEVVHTPIVHDLGARKEWASRLWPFRRSLDKSGTV